MNRYSAAQRNLHWIILILIILAYITIEFRSEFARGSTGRVFMVQSHFWLGVTILALFIPRILLRFKRGTPPVEPALPSWQANLSTLVHVAIYAFLLIQPLLGLATAWTDGKVIMLPFTGIELPALLAENEALAHQLEDLHKLLANIFYFLVGFHVLAALYHHFIRKDDTLKRMI
ncbi:MAG: cytochrome b [Arenimonas sp.]